VAETYGLIDRHDILEEVLQPHREALGSIFHGLVGHAYRMLNYCAYMAPGDPDQIDRFAVVAAFHDLPVCLTKDLRYLDTARAMADQYLTQTDNARWQPAVGAMILNHHRVRPWPGPHRPEVEAVRKADWIEATLGGYQAGVPRAFSSQLHRLFPRRELWPSALRLMGSYAIRHPAKPLPMLRW
jgi:hypothetical protein